MPEACKDYIPILKKMSMFEHINSNDMESVLHCLGGYIRDCKKEQYIILCEDNVDAVGIILEGSVHMVREDSWGNRTLLVAVEKGELFGESFSCNADQNATVSFIAAVDSKILFLPFRHIMHSCSKACRFHHQLIENMVTIMASKNVSLMDKVDILSKKTLREKIATFLMHESGKQGSNYFDIPFGRVQLAEYLCADRSALTRELNAMRDEGLIEFEKKSFHILKSL